MKEIKNYQELTHQVRSQFHGLGHNPKVPSMDVSRINIICMLLPGRFGFKMVTITKCGTQ